MKTTAPLTAALPWFPGFYNSILDSFIDREVEMEMDTTGETWEQCDERCDYQAAFRAISEAWADAFSQETGLKMEYESLESPREYNFTTDRVFVILSPDTLTKLETVRQSPEFAEILTEWFTSRDGFMSFYSNDPEAPAWQKPLVEWDHNQLSALIAAYVLSECGETRESLLESIHDRSLVYEAAQYVWKHASAQTV